MPQGILWAVLLAPIEIDRRYPNGQPHHITLQYGVNKADWVQWIDVEFNVTLHEQAWDEYSQAISVMLPAEVPCQTQTPHITVSWVDGRSPADSGRMLAGWHFSRAIVPPVSVPCLIEFFEWADVPKPLKQKPSAPSQSLDLVVHSYNKL